MGKYRELVFNITLITIGSILFVWALYRCGIGIDWRVFLILLAFAIILDNIGIMYTDIKLSLSPTIGITTFFDFWHGWSGYSHGILCYV